MLIVLVVFYAGLLLYFISGPSMGDIDNLRKLARWVLILAVAVSGLVIFLGFSMFGIGSAEEEVMDEEEVLLEEYLGLGDEEARQEAEEAGTDDEEDTEEGHA